MYRILPLILLFTAIGFLLAAADHAPGDAVSTQPLVQPLSSTAWLDVKNWERRRETLEAEWKTIPGPMPERVPLNVELLKSEQQPDHVRHLLRYQTEQGDKTYAFLLVPHDSDGNPVSRAPGAVVFHGTSSDHIYQPAGLASSLTRHLGLHLVRKGYVVVAPQCFIFRDPDDRLTTRSRGKKDWIAAVERIQARNSARTGMGKMLWDGMRAVDVLTSRPEVDSTRILAIGHSLGAKEVIYLCAFDQRVRAGIASEGGIGLSLSNWDAPWYLGRKAEWSKELERRMPRPFDHHQLLAMTAPRGIMIVGGNSADGEVSREWVRAAEPVFQLYDKSDNLRLMIHDAGHDFPSENLEESIKWAEKVMAK